MQRHEVSFVVDAPRHRVWRRFHPKTPPDAVVPRTYEHPGGSITILRDGDEDGAGLVRECTFPVPKWLLSGGVARSFEAIVESRKNEFSRYEAVGKPLWSKAEGWHTLEPLDGDRTRLTFVETYHAFGPVVRALFEARVHRFISHSNSDLIEGVLRPLGGRRE
jgi:hypothetical protein